MKSSSFWKWSRFFLKIVLPIKNTIPIKDIKENIAENRKKNLLILMVLKSGFIVFKKEKLTVASLQKYLANLDGEITCIKNFPAHEADPLKEENLIDIKKAVLKNKADLGITTDGDGDRIFFIDNKGKFFVDFVTTDIT